jgi:hypothetical protein
MHGKCGEEKQVEKKCPLCGRGLARNYGPEISCALCILLGPPSIRRKQPTSKQSDLVRSIDLIPH